jgi:hypothetical protein
LRRELAQLGLNLGARGPHPNLLAQEEVLLKRLEQLEGERRRSFKAACNASQFEERMTKQFFSQFRGGFENTDISSLHSVPDWDHPETRDPNVASEDNQIVVEFARYYTHLSRPKPSDNPEILLKAL